MILTALPDLPPRPETAANAAFRRRFYERWGHENAVVCGPACDVEFARHEQTLSIKMAFGGTGERYLLPRRDILVDDDSYLVLGEGMRYGSVVRARQPVQSFAVFFRPGMAQEVARARRQPLAEALDLHATAGPDIAFRPHLRRHDAVVSPRLRRLWRAVLQGERDEDWLETELLGLLAALLETEQAFAMEPPAAARPAARRELDRRLRLAADFIDSHATEAIDLDRMAEVACLSKYHFVREFGRLFGCTPHGWLTRKRAGIARRLIAQGEADQESVALRSGFGSRWALRRALARWPEAAPGV